MRRLDDPEKLCLVAGHLPDTAGQCCRECGVTLSPDRCADCGVRLYFTDRIADDGVCGCCRKARRVTSLTLYRLEVTR